MNPNAATSSANESIRQPGLGELHQRLCKTHNLEDLKNLCLHLGVHWEELGGETTRSAKARELILYLEQRERLAELNLAIPTPVKSIAPGKELGRHIGLRDRINTKRVLRAIRRRRLADSEINSALRTIVRVITEVRKNPEALQDSVLPALCERTARIMEHSNQAPHKLAVALPLIPAILRSPDVLGIPGADELRKLWRRLTVWWPPPVWVRIVLYVLAGILVYGFLLTFFLQDKPLGDQFPTTGDRPETLDQAKWEYRNLPKWTVKDFHLKIQSAGVALLKTEHIRSGELHDFSVNFVLGIVSGKQAAWVIRAQRLTDLKTLEGYEFRVTVNSDSTRLYLNGYRLPEEGKPLQGGGFLPIGRFNFATDCLEIDATVKDDTFSYRIRRAVVGSPTELLRDPSLTMPFSVTIKDPDNKFKGGKFGLLSRSDEDVVWIEGLYVRPAWRWF
jgi:hypothetical protein